ncbi:SRPBCC family protein [Acidobacterium sp. S8]|jgi:uncharacterized protein YndB with AHSA1/START domain|uniref:SRPBCC family protein n=1 Tax=Acidobacterium sp. S8 TaxID=1641854 RepID=UPI00131EC8D2|nr:SRPBCC family protein [Acidobacterium sp. S8]
MELKFQLHVKIQKPIDQVFDAVYNPKKITQYFATGSASAPLDEGTKVIWRFADYPGDVPVSVKKMVPNELILLEWEAGDGGYNTHVEMRFEALSKNETLITISEGNWSENQKGLNASYGNCYGWMHMSCCLKAYLEHGINLREGFFHNPKLANHG